MKSSKEKIVSVKASCEYPVIIGRDLLKRSGQIIKEKIAPCTVAVITDDNVDKLYSKVVTESLVQAGFKVVKFVFNNGEQSKSLKTYGEILSFLASNNLTRTDAVVALGGGVTGDMAGFVASTYLRGIKYVQIPTSLLAQIDSSVGGKTAIDLAEGKNLVGAFCQPTVVIADIDTLSTLPGEVYKDGLGEVCKYLLLDEKIFSLLQGDYQLEELVYLCVDYKRKIVEEDEFESGNRKLLNLGHTPAHAIEKLSGYVVTHGKAVAMGVKIMLDSSKKMGYLSAGDYELAVKTINSLVGENPCPYTAEELAENSLVDKKRSGDNITIVTVHGVGDCRTEKIHVNRLLEYLS